MRGGDQVCLSPLSVLPQLHDSDELTHGVQMVTAVTVLGLLRSLSLSPLCFQISGVGQPKAEGKHRTEASVKVQQPSMESIYRLSDPCGPLPETCSYQNVGMFISKQGREKAHDSLCFREVNWKMRLLIVKTP